MEKKHFHTHIPKVFLLWPMLLLCVSVKAQHLEGYLEEAMTNNPEIHAYDLRYQLAAEKVNETVTIPNTELGVGYFIGGPQTRTGDQKLKFSIKQMVPWFGSLTARENYASSMADAEYMEVAIAKRKLALEVSKSYYRLYAIRAKIKVVTEQIRLISTYKEMALTAVQTGTASAVDVLKLDMRHNELEAERMILQKNDTSEKSVFNTLLNQKSSTNVVVSDTLVLPPKDSIVALDNLKFHPELIKYDKLYESVNRAELQNRKEAQPNIGLGVDYISVSRRQDMDIADNGHDILMPTVSFSIPVFNGKYKSISKQNELKKLVLDEQKNNRENQLMSLLQTAIDERDVARVNVETQDRNWLQAQNAQEILIKSFETNTIDFNDILDIQELQLKIELDKIESVKEYYQQMAIVNYISNLK